MLYAADLCLVSDVILPIDFKTLKFDKYKGSACLQTHLAMYCKKIAAYVQEDKILIHCFQDSLSGVALSWYVSLERGRIKTWKDLAEAFLKQYKYNKEMAPDWSCLQNMTKRDQEGFKEYAQNWREVATSVQPPLTEKEMVSTFIDTLSSPFYEIVVGSVSSSFADLVMIGERVEVGLKRGKFTLNTSHVGFAKRATQERKKGEVNAVITDMTLGYGRGKPLHIQVGKEGPSTIKIAPTTPIYLPYQLANATRANADVDAKPVNKRNTPRTLDPVLVPYVELLKTLLEKKLRVKQGPNIKNNPLLEHGSSTVNSIKHEQYGDESIVVLDEEAMENSLRLPCMIDRTEGGARRIEGGRIAIVEVAIVREDESPLPKLLVICYNPTTQKKLPLIILIPKPKYTDSHAIPWKYQEGEAMPK
ncbi:hypothetical protein CR513_58401, partial [Mucuna pruriens]